MRNNRKMIGYKLVLSYGVEELNEKVNGLILEGWEIYGSPFIRKWAYHDDDYFQAMVKYDDHILKGVL